MSQRTWTDRRYVIVCTRNNDQSEFLWLPFYWSQKEAIDGSLAMDTELMPGSPRLARWHAFKPTWGARVEAATVTVELLR